MCSHYLTCHNDQPDALPSFILQQNQYSLPIICKNLYACLFTCDMPQLYQLCFNIDMVL